MKVTLIQREEMTGKERRAWDEARSALLYEAPMWSHLWYTMMTGKDGEQALYARDLAATAACDDRRIWINPDQFCERSLGHRVFILAHEISHGMFGHGTLSYALQKAGKVVYPDGKEYTFDKETFEKAKDYYVNDMLVQGEIGVMPPDALHDPKWHAKMKLLDIYRGIMDEQEQNPPPPPQGGSGESDAPGGGAGDQPPQHGGFDQHPEPGSGDGIAPDQAAMERDDEEWKTEMRAAADNARAQGKLPGFIDEMLTDALGSETDWRDRMRTLLARGVGTGAFSWQHPDRRMITRDDMIIAPGRRGFKCKLIVIVGDSSGSIGQATASAFFAEMDKIVDELEPEEMMFAWCDAKVHGWSSVDTYDGIMTIRKGGIKGRGGTDFRPPFEDIAKMGLQPDAVIYLSDLYGPFPLDPPPYQVIWGRVHSQVQPPFGDVVDIPIKTIG